jgi:hypothetical protein
LYITCMGCTQRNFGCNRLLMKRTWLEEHRTFSSVTMLLLQQISWNSIPVTFSPRTVKAASLYLIGQ